MDRTQAGIVTISVVGIFLILLFGNPLKIRIAEETESMGATQAANQSRTHASDNSLRIERKQA